MLFYLLFSIALTAICGGFAYLKFVKKADFHGEKYSRLMKILAVTYFLLMFMNLFLPDGFVLSKSEETLADMNAVYENTVRWLNCTCIIVIPLLAFYDNKCLNKVAAYFCLPASLLYAYSYSVIIQSLTSENGRGIRTIRFFSEEFKAFLIDERFRGVLFALLCLLQIGLLFFFLLKNCKDLKFEKGEVLPFLLVVAGLMILSISTYTPQYYIGYTELVFKRFSWTHLLVFLWMTAEVVVLYFLFRDKPREVKRMLLIAMSISLLFQFNQVFTAIGEIRVQKFPLQLCNIGSYLLLILLVSKNEKLFHFAIIVNVVGALIAMIVLDVENKGIGYFWNVHYILEHSKLITVPILCLLLKEFQPLQIKDIKHFLIGFAIYFSIAWILGTLCNGIYYRTENDYFKNNFLFMFDKSAAQGLLPWVGALFDIQWSIGPFKLYPIVQMLVFFAFNGMCVLGFFAIYFCGKIGQKRKQKEEAAAPAAA